MRRADDIGTIVRPVWGWLLSGTALTIPLVITVLVLGVVANVLLDIVSPVVTLVRIVPGVDPVVEGFLVQLISLVSLLGFVIGVGAAADLTEDTYAPRFHAAVETIPVVGDVYRGFRRMSDVFVESDVETFREVKLVEFPHEGAYSLAFVTADTPGTIRAAAGEVEMQTLFVPLAPNPVMGGFLVNFAADQVYEVDLTVEEAVQSIVTSGVSMEAAGGPRTGPVSADGPGGAATDRIDDGVDGADAGDGRPGGDGTDG